MTSTPLFGTPTALSRQLAATPDLTPTQKAAHTSKLGELFVGIPQPVHPPEEGIYGEKKMKTIQSHDGGYRSVMRGGIGDQRRAPSLRPKSAAATLVDS